MAQAVVLVIGVSGAGKSWICRQLTKEFHYVPHDACWEHPDAKPTGGLNARWGPPGSRSTHTSCLIEAAKTAAKPVLSEVPFGERVLMEELDKAGVKTVPVFVIEPDGIVAARYEAREGKQPQKGVLTRARSLISRAKEWGAYHGTSEEVLEHLRRWISSKKGSLGRTLGRATTKSHGKP